MASKVAEVAQRRDVHRGAASRSPGCSSSPTASASPSSRSRERTASATSTYVAALDVALTDDDREELDPLADQVVGSPLLTASSPAQS